MMNDTLTFDILVDFWREYKTKGESFDIILLTNQEWSSILKATDLDASIKDPLYCGQQLIMGKPYELYSSKEKVLERAEELIKEGKKVVVIK